MSRPFAHLETEQSLEDGVEYIFAGDSPTLWDDVAAFVDEESACCPFFTFDQRETADGIVLRIAAPTDAH